MPSTCCVSVKYIMMDCSNSIKLIHIIEIICLCFCSDVVSVKFSKELMDFESWDGPKCLSASHESRDQRAAEGRGVKKLGGGGARVETRNTTVIRNNESWWQGPMMHNDHQTLTLLVTLSVSVVFRPSLSQQARWSVICEHSESISIKSWWLMLDHYFTAPRRRYWEPEIRHNWLTGPLTIPPRLLTWNLTHNDNGPGSHHPMVTDGQAQEDPPLANLTW